MASLNEQQAGRDAESFDNDRHDGMYSAGGSRAHWFPAEPSTGPDLSISSDRGADITRVNAETNALFDRLMAPKAVKLERAA